MGYLHIDNLYKAQEILAFKECYALEKIHGTSAHIQWSKERLSFFSGGENYNNFIKLFNQEQLIEIIAEKVGIARCIVYGEAYGGKCQGMSKTYGKELKFVVFDVKIEDCWLTVPQACDFTTSIGLEFVDWAKITTDIPAIDAERDKPSIQAVRNGITEPRAREGIVLRPPFEVTLNNGSRVIAKHKRPEFSERQSVPDVNPEKRQILEEAEAIAMEWVNLMRLQHVLDKLPGEKDISLTGEVVKAMVEDVIREAAGEILDSKPARRAIGARAAKLYKQHLSAIFTPVADF